mmetsp:Transcript_32706/g.63816  ORF Transcript_32706/g.63816 Transcript_32706/m.63816 type:complete len:392 (-) Transcript_32706:149-1324(-)
MESVSQYKSQLASTNMRRIRYVDNELPSLLERLQSVEEMRISSLKQSFLSYSKRLQDLSERFGKMATTMKQVASAMDVKGDLNNYVANLGARPDAPPPDVQWTLSMSLEELKNESLRLHAESKGGLFNGTFEDIMNLQKATQPNMEVPEILHRLLEKVEVLGGFQTEGIFRLSAAQVDLKILRAQIERGDYSMKNVISPHVPAGMLKEWLRGLREVIIPDALYHECIAITKIHEKNNMEFVPESRRRLNTVLGMIPPVNLAVLKTLVRIVMLASHPANVGKTKMTEKNMAIVFAPSILHNPSTDPMSMLHNAKYEIEFAVLCVDALSNEQAAAVATAVTTGSCVSTPRHKEALAPLMWKSYVDQETGRTFYYNPATQETQWEPPTLIQKIS